MKEQDKSIIHRECVRLIVVNPINKILFFCAIDPQTTDLDGKDRGRFWFLAGGACKPGESHTQAIYRELYEETGLTQNQVKLSPLIGYEDFVFLRSNIKTHMKNYYYIIKTNVTKISLDNLTLTEQKVIQEYKFFSTQEILNNPEKIYPEKFYTHIENLLANNLSKKLINFG